MNKEFKNTIFNTLDMLTIEINEYLSAIDSITDEELKIRYTIVLDKLIETQKDLIGILHESDQRPKKKKVEVNVEKELEKFLKVNTDKSFPSKQPPIDNFMVRELTII